MYVPLFIPNPETQLLFNGSNKSSYTISFDSWSTDRKTIDTQLENQVSIRSAQNNNSPKYLVMAHQTAVGIGVPNKANNIASFHNLDVGNYHVDIDCVRYPRDDVNIDYGLNVYVDQYRDLKVFYKEYVREELLNPFISFRI